jgi:hypothetical protein
MVSGQKGFSSIVEKLINILILTFVGRIVTHVDAISQIIVTNLCVGVDTSVVV